MWRPWKIDLIARQGKTFVFIEVKRGRWAGDYRGRFLSVGWAWPTYA